MPTAPALTYLSDRINSLAESQTIAMAKKARELAAQGVNVINLSFGEPNFVTPSHIREAAKKALDDGHTYYTPVAGIPELRQAIAEKLRRDNDLNWKAENIVVSTGAKQSIANAILCLINPGDEVLILSPYWVSYSEVVRLAEGVPVLVEGTLENDYKATAAQVEAALTPRTKLLMFSSPCNPTGAVFSRSELEAIAALVARHDNLFVLADEIYEYIIYGEKPFSIGAVPAIADRVVTVNGFSKAFAMTGWRLGYLAAAKPIADACDKMQSQITSGTSSVAQRAGLVALQSDLQPTYDMVAAFRRRRELVIAGLREIPGLKVPMPEGAFYAFPDVSAYFGKSDGPHQINDADDLAMYLLNQAHVSVVTGAAFGEPRCIRLSFAASDDSLREALTRMQKAFAVLK